MAHWAGTTPVTNQLCLEAIARYSSLAAELDLPPDLPPLMIDRPLLLTIEAAADPQAALARAQSFRVPPTLLDPREAAALEPLLNPGAIAGALLTHHGQVHPETLVQTYRRGLVQAGGGLAIAQVQHLLRRGDQVTGVALQQPNDLGLALLEAPHTILCAGGQGRQLLQDLDPSLEIPLHFTLAEMLQTAPLNSPRDPQLQTIVMAADLKRPGLEALARSAQISAPETAPEIPPETAPEIIPTPSILDAGALQFPDGHIRFGQVSRLATDSMVAIDASASEQWIRQAVGQLLPSLAKIPATWHHCLVAFNTEGIALVGAIAPWSGLSLFTGFNSPFLYVPPLAQRYAQQLLGAPDAVITQLQTR